MKIIKAILTKAPKANIYIYIYSLVLLILSVKLSFNIALGIDSGAQFSQAVSGKYSAWHPVAMSILWSALYKIFHFQQILRIFHLLLIYVGLTLFAVNLKKYSKYLIFIPQTIYFLFVVIFCLWKRSIYMFASLADFSGKDISLFAILIFIFGLLTSLKNLNKNWQFKLVVALLFISLWYATIVRSNGIAATWIIIIFLVHICLKKWKPNLKPNYQKLIAVIVGVLISGIFFISNGLLSKSVNASNSSASITLFYMDISAMADDGDYKYMQTYYPEIYQAIRDNGERYPICNNRNQPNWCVVGFFDYNKAILDKYKQLYKHIVTEKIPQYISYKIKASFTWLIETETSRAPTQHTFLRAYKLFILLIDLLMIGLICFRKKLPIVSKLKIENSSLLLVMLICSFTYLLGFAPLALVTDVRYVFSSIFITGLATIGVFASIFGGSFFNHKHKNG